MADMNEKIMEAMYKSEALHNPTPEGQFIVNKKQLDKMHQLLYGGHKQVKGTFSDDWSNWTQSFVTNQNPDGDYVTGVTGRDGHPASLMAIYSSPFCDLVSLVGMVDYISPLRLGYYQGKTASQGEISRKINGDKDSLGIKREASVKYHEMMNYSKESTLDYISMAGALASVKEQFGSVAELEKYREEFENASLNHNLKSLGITEDDEAEDGNTKKAKDPTSGKTTQKRGPRALTSYRGSRRPSKPSRISVPKKGGSRRGGSRPPVKHIDGGNSEFMFSDVEYLNDNSGNQVTYSYGETKLESQEDSYVFDWSNISTDIDTLPELEIMDKASRWEHDYSYV